MSLGKIWQWWKCVPLAIGAEGGTWFWNMGKKVLADLSMPNTGYLRDIETRFNCKSK